MSGAIDNNNPNIYWFVGGPTNPLTIGNELWQVAMQATTWGTNTVDLQTAPLVGGTFTTVHTFSANGIYQFRPGACRMKFVVNGTTPTGLRQTVSRIPEPDQSDTITGSIVAGGTGLSTAAPVDGGSYTLAGTISAAATDLKLKLMPFEDAISNIPTAILPIATAVPVGAFSFSGILLPKATSVVIQAVNTASGVSFTLTKDIGDNRRCQSNTLRNFPNAAGNPINFDNSLYMFLADGTSWTTQTVVLEADLGSGYVSIAPALDNTRAPRTLAVTAAAGTTAPFRFHPSAAIAGLSCAYAQIPVDAIDDAPQGTLNTANGTRITTDVVGGTYDLGFSVNHGTAGNTDMVFNWSPHGAAPPANLTLPLATFLAANNAGGDGFGNYANVIKCPPGQLYITSSNGAVTVSITGAQSQGGQRLQGD